jgi:hypothetical protein
MRCARRTAPRCDVAPCADKLAELPEDNAECETEAEASETAAERLCFSDRGSLQRFKVVCSAVEALEKAASERTAGIARLQAELDADKAAWLPQLKEKVARVSAAFSANFRRIGSVGEIELFEDGDTFEAYAIHIKVKFRDEGALEVRSCATAAAAAARACVSARVRSAAPLHCLAAMCCAVTAWHEGMRTCMGAGAVAGDSLRRREERVHDHVPAEPAAHHAYAVPHR